MIEFQKCRAVVWPETGRDDLSLKIPAGPIVRPARAEWGRQDDDDQNARRLAAAERGQRAGLRATTSCGNRARRAELVGFVPDEVYLYEKLSGREFLEFVADLHGLNRRDAAVRIAAQIDAFELAAVRRRSQRDLFARHEAAVALAAALSARSGGAGARRADGRPRSAQHAVGEETCCAAHGGRSDSSSCRRIRFRMAEEIAERSAIVDHGRLIFFGTLAELERQAAHEHDVAGGTVSGADRRRRARSNGSATLGNDRRGIHSRAVAMTARDPPATAAASRELRRGAAGQRRRRSSCSPVARARQSSGRCGGDWSLASLRRLFRSGPAAGHAGGLAQHRVLGRLFFLFYSGFDLLAGLYPLAVESLYNAFFASLMVMLLFSSGIIMYTNLVPLAGGDILVDDAGSAGANFRLSVSRGDLVQQLGLFVVGEPDAGGRWRRRPSAVALLCADAAVHVVVSVYSSGAGRHLVPVGGRSAGANSLGHVRGLRGGDRGAAVARLVGAESAAQSDLLTPRWFQELSCGCDLPKIACCRVGG